MYNEIIYLIAEKITERDEYGNRVVETEKRERFADMRSVGSSEFYQAARVGLQPSIKAVLSDPANYNNEAYFEYNGKTYLITRTYINKAYELELTGSKLRGTENE